MSHDEVRRWLAELVVGAKMQRDNRPVEVQIAEVLERLK